MHRTTDEKWKVIRFFLLEEKRKRLRFIFHDAAAYYGGFFVKLYLKGPVSMMNRFSAKDSCNILMAPTNLT